MTPMTNSVLTKIATVLIMIILLVDQTYSKALPQPTQSTAMPLLSAKWLSWKLCGKLNDICRPESQRYCCSVGFTCVTKKRRTKIATLGKSFGKCLPVPTLSQINIEIEISEQQR